MRPSDSIFLLPLLLVSSCDHGDAVHASTKTTTADRDNTAVNARDRDGTTLTPMDQSNAAGDIELVQRVRKALVDDSTLSTAAKNVKVITRDGKVSLRGTVPNVAERAKIESLARACAGAVSVDNQIETEAR